MGRVSRGKLLYDGCYAHVISRSIAKQRIFQVDKDFQFFEKLLNKARKEYGFSIFHYCLMHTHFHLIVGVNSVAGFSKGMKQVKWEYTQAYNKQRKRRGPLWQNRYKSLLIENEQYLYACGLYIEENPVSAGMVNAAERWKYSSRRHYLGIVKNELISDYGTHEVPDGVNLSNGLEFERGVGVGSDWFKYRLKKNFA